VSGIERGALVGLDGPELGGEVDMDLALTVIWRLEILPVPGASVRDAKMAGSGGGRSGCPMRERTISEASAKERDDV
jgi:hypothetical protein